MTTAAISLSTGTAGGDAAAQLRGIAQALGRIADGVVQIGSDDLAEVAAAATAMVVAAEAARAAVVLEAYERGVILASDHPRVDHWVEQSARDAGVPVSRVQARQLKDVTSVVDAHDLGLLREAVTDGRVPMDSAAVVARVFRRWKLHTEGGAWDEILRILIDWAAEGAGRRELERLEDLVLGQYGTAGALDDDHARQYGRRSLSTFRRDHTGMLTATLRLDPASEAVVTAAIQALSVPTPADDGTPDDRTPAQRRADALVSVAGLATTPRPSVPGSGTKARVVVTMTLDALLSGLQDHAHRSADAFRPFTRTERGYATTGFTGALSPTEARMLACDAQIVPAVLGGEGEVLDLGRAKRLVTPALGHALQLRDGGCSFPGCSAPPGWCDGHHIEHWAAGGTTDMRNLALLCRHHHVEVHRRGHTATVDDGGVHWTRADGSPIGNHPRGPRPESSPRRRTEPTVTENARLGTDPSCRE